MEQMVRVRNDQGRGKKQDRSASTAGTARFQPNCLAFDHGNPEKARNLAMLL